MPTPFLIWTRMVLFAWMWGALACVEPAFDAIEAELDRRGVDPEVLP